MLLHKRLFIGLGLMLILFLLISCAQAAGNTGTPGQIQNVATPTVSVSSVQPVSTVTVTIDPTSVRPVLTMTPASRPTPIQPVVTATSATPATTPTGMVSLTTSASHYLVTNTIVVTLSNQTNQQISFPDHLTDCTTILLQLQVPGGWQSVGECQLMIRTSEHILDPGQSVVVALKAPGQWTAGLYQVAMNYMSASHPTAGKEIFSSTFTVGTHT